MDFHSDLGSLRPYGQNFLPPQLPASNIPFEDWNHARALVTKYPPQIVLWIIREVSCGELLNDTEQKYSSDKQL